MWSSSEYSQASARNLFTTNGYAVVGIYIKDYSATDRRVRASTYGEYLWSSSEGSQSNVSYLGMDNGCVGNPNKDTNTPWRRVRAI